MRRDSGARNRHGAVWRAVRNAALITLALAAVATCARTSVENVNRPAGVLPRPQQIVVHDFGVTPADVSLDSAVGARLKRMVQDTPASEQELSVGLATTHGQTVEADAQHTAAAIAQELKKFFAEQGWIAPP